MALRAASGRDNCDTKYCHNLAGLMRFYVEADAAVPAGKHQVRMEFAYDGGGLAKGGAVTLYIDGARSAPARTTTIT